MENTQPKRMRFYGLRDVDKLPQLQELTEEQRFAIKVVGNVLPFRTNNYVVEELIDWNNIPEDPMFQLTFMQKGMLSEENFNHMADALRAEKSPAEIKEIANEIRLNLNPHPAGQLTANVPKLGDEPVPGVQHKYNETCLIFPTAGQTCFAYCTFCFRWPQFVGMDDLKFATKESGIFQDYIREHKEISDIILTGGDPMIMKANKLRLFIEPFLKPEFDHVKNIRIGTKSLSYWPYRFLTDKDAEDILALYEEVSKAGKQLAFMAHFNHPVELQTPAVREAIRKIRATGAQIRAQAPLLRGINDSADLWAEMWQEQARLGVIPYYMFVERDTGPKAYFELPLERAWEIYREAVSRVSGLARTVRGPSMSALPGKVAVQGVAEVNGEKVFVLNFLQGRNHEWCGKPFFAKYDPEATWLDQLEPAFGEKFFYQDELDGMLAANRKDDSPGLKTSEEEMDRAEVEAL